MKFEAFGELKLQESRSISWIFVIFVGIAALSIVTLDTPVIKFRRDLDRSKVIGSVRDERLSWNVRRGGGKFWGRVDKVSRWMGEKDSGGPLRIDSRPSRWSVTRETERTGEKVGRTDILSLFLSHPEDWSTENTEAKRRKKMVRARETEMVKGVARKERSTEKGVVERWKVEKRRQ